MSGTCSSFGSVCISVPLASRHLSLLRGLEQSLFPLVSSLSPQHFTKEGKGGAFHIVYLVSSGLQVVAAPDPMTGTFFDTLHFAESYHAAERFCIVFCDSRKSNHPKNVTSSYHHEYPLSGPYRIIHIHMLFSV